MSLKYESSSEPLQISVKWLFLERTSVYDSGLNPVHQTNAGIAGAAEDGGGLYLDGYPGMASIVLVALESGVAGEVRG